MTKENKQKLNKIILKFIGKSILSTAFYGFLFTWALIASGYISVTLLQSEEAGHFLAFGSSLIFFLGLQTEIVQHYDILKKEVEKISPSDTQK